MTSGANEVPSRLQRSLGTRGAVVVGLSAMLGTGVFVVWTPALTLAGSQLLVALALATVVAALNASSTARLARIIPESGGAYAYGRKLLSRPVGVLAGLVFVIGKAASASAAALAIGVYLWPEHDRFIAWLAIGIALAIDLRGVVKSMSVSALLVALVLVVILLVAIAGARAAHSATFTPLPATVLGVVAASGLLFVAFAGYARITVLGEEVRDPARTIPRAMLISFAIVAVTYGALATVMLGLAHSGLTFGQAPLATVAEAAGWGSLQAMVPLAATLGAGAVLLSLIAGIGRTVFAMAAQGDAPRALAIVGRTIAIPYRAEIAGAALAAVLVGVGRLGWSLALSALTILIYYAIAHLAAFTLPRMKWVPVIGLIGCAVVIIGLVATITLGQLPAT